MILCNLPFYSHFGSSPSRVCFPHTKHIPLKRAKRRGHGGGLLAFRLWRNNQKPKSSKQSNEENEEATTMWVGLFLPKWLTNQRQQRSLERWHITFGRACLRNCKHGVEAKPIIFFPSHVQGQRKHRVLQGKLKLWMATWREMAPDFLVVRHFDNLLVPLLVTLMLLVSAI